MSDKRGSGSAAWHRWQLDEFVAPHGPASARPAAAAHDPLLAARRERVRRDAAEAERRAGFEAGRAAGLEQGLAEGRARGLEQGLAEGRAQARAEAEAEFDRRCREELEPLRALATAFGEALGELDHLVADELAELALVTGRQLAFDALRTRPQQVLEIVRLLLHSEPAPAGQPRLWLNPEDCRLVERHLGSELQAAGWTLQPDDALQRGDCRLASPGGELDATWETRWKAVKAQLRRRRAASGDSDSKPDDHD